MNIRRKIGSLVVGVLLVLLGACRKRNGGEMHIQEPQAISSFFDADQVDRASYLYAPGMMNTELGMGRYCPDLVASTGERVSWRSGGHVIDYPHSAVAFSDVDLRKPTYFTLNPLTSLINRFRMGLAPLAQRFLQDNLDFTVEDNPSSELSVVNYSFNFSKGNFGQRRDIKTFHKTYQSHIKKYPGTSVVLYGDSRGAATIFNFIALYNPSEVKAAVLDGVFDSIPHVVKHFIYTDKDVCTENALYNIVSSVMRDYRKDGIDPRQCVEIISDEIPLLLVISLKDGLVAPQSAFYLYNRLLERGHKKVHLLVLKDALHPSYMIGSSEDKKIYEAVVHAFYKKYNLPHNISLALQGAEHLKGTQPTTEYLIKEYNLLSCECCDITQPEKITQKKVKRVLRYVARN